ncbi:MAG: biotin/lipoyl-binding protein, partial [Vulcanimicrobiota bacterium]
MLKKVVPLVVLAVVVCLLYWGAHRADPKPDFYSGVVEATETQLSFQRGGTLEPIAFEEGDAITKGQPVASLDARELEAELAGAKAEA